MIDILAFVPDAAPFDREAIERAAAHVLAAEEIDEAELSIALLGDAEIADLNMLHLGHDGPTDVISFPLYEDGAAPVGDVYVGWEQCLRQADAEGVAPQEEMVRLVVHGVLHVLGYDHPKGKGRTDSEMWQLQEILVKELVPAPSRS